MTPTFRAISRARYVKKSFVYNAPPVGHFRYYSKSLFLLPIDPDDVPSDFRRGLEQSLEAVSSPEPENEATETNTSTPDNVKDQSDSSNLDDDLLLMDQHLELIYD